MEGSPAYGPNDTLERAEVRRLMRGTPDGEQGLSGLDAVLSVIAKDHDTPPDDLVRKALELIGYAWGFAHGMHTMDLPDLPGVCGPHLAVMREGHSHGLAVLPWEMNPVPLERTVSEEL